MIDVNSCLMTYSQIYALIIGACLGAIALLCFAAAVDAVISIIENLRRQRLK
jgi:hypothetical protein